MPCHFTCVPTIKSFCVFASTQHPASNDDQIANPVQGAILCVRIATFMGIAWLVAFFALKFTKVVDCQNRHHGQGACFKQITNVITAAEETSGALHSR